jgi:hypothetical protein
MQTFICQINRVARDGIRTPSMLLLSAGGILYLIIQGITPRPGYTGGPVDRQLA